MKYVVILLITAWQKLLGPVWRSLLQTGFGVVSECKHSPSCSQYTLIQIQKHGTIRGLWRGFRQVLSCR